MLAEMRQQGATVYDREAAIVLRAIEQGGPRDAQGRARGCSVSDARWLACSSATARRPAAAPRTQPFVDHSLGINYNLEFAPAANWADPCGIFQDSVEIMAKRCEICDKGPVVGRTISHAHNVGPRRFEPNLQSVRALINGATKRIRVCTRCLRSGKVTKAA